MTERETRLANAMIEAVKNGDYLPRYIVIVLEDDSKYGWLSPEAKEYIFQKIDEV